ncbi:agamous-like MADS-box protein MADS4 isoform X3 [Helianthus annuus]|uniref:agamous-like MADS-box protein MADS4 isoform X3 n=1 Tax=Helianthus annuus TaxID=4232 RepID=UPI000B8F8A2E|nr:agamous-like MADS-box protein MADS4 isoform X3 [Helianthus annuus]
MAFNLSFHFMTEYIFSLILSSMLKTLERYQKCNYEAPESNHTAREALELSSQQEYMKLKAKYEALQRSQRNLLGEDLGPLNCKELESLERQLDTSLKHIRSARTQLMLDTLTDLQKKEHALNEANSTLKQRLIEGNQINSLHWFQHAEQQVCYDRQPAPPQQSEETFFHPLDCGPTLHIGYQMDPLTTTEAGPSMNNYMQGWLPC